MSFGTHFYVTLSPRGRMTKFGQWNAKPPEPPSFNVKASSNEDVNSGLLEYERVATNNAILQAQKQFDEWNRFRTQVADDYQRYLNEKILVSDFAKWAGKQPDGHQRLQDGEDFWKGSAPNLQQAVQLAITAAEAFEQKSKPA